MYKKNLLLNYLQWLICHKTKPNQTKYSVLSEEKTLSGFSMPMKKVKFIYKFTYTNETEIA